MIDICCLQETRRKSNGVCHVNSDKEKYKLFWNGQKTAKNGVGIIVREPLAQEVLDIERINSHDLFDIAHANALSMISVAEDRKFLLIQQQKGIRESMAGTDTKKQNEKAVLLISSSSSAEEIQKTGQDRYADDEVLVEGYSYQTPAKRKRDAKLASGSGEAQAEAVHTALEDWDIKSSVRAMCFDTTSSNSGRIVGACVLLEQNLRKGLLSLACRHPIMELIINAVYQVCLGDISSPEISGTEPLFFANRYLAESQPRDDYREFLGLVVIFLALSQQEESDSWHLGPCMLAGSQNNFGNREKNGKCHENYINTEPAQQDHTKRITVDLPAFTRKKFEDFFLAKSFTLFQLMELPHEFLNEDPDIWEAQEDYQQASEAVHSMSMVNDHAERGVTLIQEVSGITIKDESHLQFLLLTVEQHRQAYPGSKKHTLLKLRPSTSSVSSVARHKLSALNSCIIKSSLLFDYI
ncbi:hypothetical protein HELRODRAFT_176074 [Helobdella robusta]|uniref:Uncharacterized protein n=1 Tax=Helobdella robusta TaxID=6412 RepID=T1FA41_HELRO|nr:hypothetical protein HELRODRAFT_176074 [Helobdella robusta]ESO00230.1 hypothetical protein HELRODRAFT_176074 [Helobdella robusta]